MKKKVISALVGFVMIIFMISCFLSLNLSKQKEHIYASASWPKAYDDMLELADESNVIGVVEVISVDKEYYIAENIPVTEFKVKVVLPIKGTSENSYYNVLQTGINNNTLWFEIEDDPLMQIGQQYFIFAFSNNLGSLSITGGPQGRFTYENEKITSILLPNTNVAYRTTAASSIYSKDILVSDLDINKVIAKLD